MITISLDEKNANLILNILKSRLDNINGQIKQLEDDKKGLEELISNLDPKISPYIAINPIKEPIKEPIIGEEIEHIHEEKNHINSGFIFKEINFDHKSLPEVVFGKNIFRRSDQKIYVTRTGYKTGIKARLEDLIYLQEHPFELESALSNTSVTKKTILTRILKEVDFYKLDMVFQSQEQTKDQILEEEKTEIIQTDEKQIDN